MATGSSPVGFSPASTAIVVDGRGETRVMADRSHLDTTEVIEEVVGGSWVVGAPDLDVALELAAEGPKARRGKVGARRFDGLA